MTPLQKQSGVNTLQVGPLSGISWNSFHQQYALTFVQILKETDEL